MLGATNGALTRGAVGSSVDGSGATIPESANDAASGAATGALVRGVVMRGVTGSGSDTIAGTDGALTRGALTIGALTRGVLTRGVIALSTSGARSVGVLWRGGSGANAAADATGALTRGGAGGAMVAVPPPLEANSGALTGAAKSALACSVPATCRTPPHTEQRARTPPSGTRNGSMRNTERHSGQVTFMRPPGCRTGRRIVHPAARGRPPGPGGDPR